MAKKIRFDRLENVAVSLDQTPVPQAFTMSRFAHSSNRGELCGTPACALGNYAARGDLQKAFKISVRPSDFDGELVADLGDKYGNELEGYDDELVLRHFGLTQEQAEELFGPEGCDGATTTKTASKYIRRFIKREQRKAK